VNAASILNVTNCILHRAGKRCAMGELRAIG
jgi:hypothetical protein